MSQRVAQSRELAHRFHIRPKSRLTFELKPSFTASEAILMSKANTLADFRRLTTDLLLSGDPPFPPCTLSPSPLVTFGEFSALPEMVVSASTAFPSAELFATRVSFLTEPGLFLITRLPPPPVHPLLLFFVVVVVWKAFTWRTVPPEATPFEGDWSASSLRMMAV
ncbi:hypothetical protein TYRP_021491 [Tyrophagus putrescentiae]|nr:hypothetical protein TYRP_021491 [Tyrophagus putrescentiae]